MSTMNISLTEDLRSYVDEQVNERGFSTTSEYVRELIRKDLERTSLRAVLLEGAFSEPAETADENYFKGLRQRVQKAQ
jgi:antitoxin ParD1/3/4